MTILRELSYLVILFAVCMLVFNYAEAGIDMQRVKPYEMETVIGMNEDGEYVTFGDVYEYQSENKPDLLVYCKAKGSIVLTIFQERTEISVEDMLADAERVKKKSGMVYYLEAVRLINDITRKNEGTGEYLIEGTKEERDTRAKSEFGACILQEY